MKITKLENINKTKVNVYIDGEFSFCAYPADLKAMQLEEKDEISEEVLENFFNEILTKRARKKAMDILTKQDRCEVELISKLKDCGYPDIVLENAVSYVKSFGYVNDERYVLNYIRYGLNRKSMMQIEFELTQKGISKQLISHCKELLRDTEDEEEDMESSAIKQVLMKKLGISSYMLEDGNLPEIDPEKKQKVKMYLYRKGYPMEKVNKAIKFLDKNM